MGSVDVLLARGVEWPSVPSRGRGHRPRCDRECKEGSLGRADPSEREVDPLVRVRVHSLVLGEAECLRRTWIPPCLPWGVFMI